MPRIPVELASTPATVRNEERRCFGLGEKKVLDIVDQRLEVEKISEKTGISSTGLNAQSERRVMRSTRS